MPRHSELCIISDCHLGTPHCRDAELLDYLRDIQPERLVINGDLCDLGTYFTRHWPTRHQAILRRILELSDQGCEVIYVIGNHDAPMHRFADILPGIHCCREYRCRHGGREIIFTHGHRFDKQICTLPFIRKIGGLGYELLQRLEMNINLAARWLHLGELNMVRAIKHHVPGAKSAIRRFEQAAIDLAVAEGIDVICCGHIHVPRASDLVREGQAISYLNSGDWVEHCTAIEASAGVFTLHQHSLAEANADAPGMLPDFAPEAIDAA